MEVHSVTFEMIEYWCSRQMTRQCSAVNGAEVYQFELVGMVEKIYICLTL